MIKFVVISLLFSSFGMAKISTEEVPPSYDEYEGATLVDLLIDDGRIELAEKILFDSKLSKVVNLYYKGQILSFQKKEKEALSLYNEAIDLSQNKEMREKLFLESSIAHFTLKNYQDCTSNFGKLKNILTVAQKIMFALCAHKSGELEKSYQLLKSDNDPKIKIALVEFLYALHLKNEALNECRQFILKAKSAFEAMSCLDVFSKIEKAHLLEFLKIRFPNDTQVLATWAQSAFERGFLRQSADAFYQSAINGEGQYYAASAEIYRSLKMFETAGYIGQSIINEEAHLKFKVSLALDRNRYVELMGLSGPVSRSSLFKDEDIIYTLLYSNFVSGQKDRARSYFSYLSKQELILKAKKLFQEN